MKIKQEALEKLLSGYLIFGQNESKQRMGQWLVNNYVNGTWPELFYEEDDEKALNMFLELLMENG